MLRILLFVILFFNALLAFLLFVIFDKATFNITIILALLSSIISFYLNKNNIIYFFRILIIAWVSVIPALAIFQNAFFSKRMVYLQTEEVGWLFSIVACLSLFSSQIGFFLANKKKFKINKGLDFTKANKVIFFYILVLIIIFGYLISLQRGDFIFNTEYRKGIKTSIIINNLQSASTILLCWLFILLNRINYNYSIYRSNFFSIYNLYSLAFIFAFFYIVFWSQLFRGSRMDPLTIVFALLILNLSLKSEKVIFNFKYFFLLIFGIMIMQFLAILRTKMHLDLPLSYYLNFDIFGSRQVSVSNVEVKYFFDGTFPNISTGIAAVFNAIKYELTEFLYGKSYLDYILRIPPKFIYPDRPETLANLIQYWFDDNHGGGFNEIAEIYLNFGIYGFLILPGIISYIIGYSYNRHLSNPYNIRESIFFIAIISVYVRFLLYQTFAGFKSLVTALFLYFSIYIFYILVLSFFKRKKNSKNLSKLV